MFDILFQPSTGVLSIQHDAVISGTDYALGATGDPAPPPPIKLVNDTMQSAGQNTDGPQPPPPIKFTTDMLQTIGQDMDGGPRPPTKFENDVMQSVGQMDGPLPPPPVK
jgi:hypothetical protein